MFRGLSWLMIASGLWLMPVEAQTLSKAEELYRRTDYEASLALLNRKTLDPATDYLIGRDYFMLGDFRQSSEYLEKAVGSAPTDSEYVDWLGRAYGKRAETSNIVTAPGWASKARQAFERAVALDPKNSDALSDLFDYYLEAPGFMGGGYDKAVGVAQRIAVIDPSEGYYASSKLAQHRKEYGAAEQRLRQAVAAAPKEVGHMINLARFLATQGRTKESDAVFMQAEKTAPDAPQVWFARADTYIRQKRNYQEARELLDRYMKAPITVDDPPREEAKRLLKQVGGA